eukprot:9503691-Pyramimonas_sp.AAC.1
MTDLFTSTATLALARAYGATRAASCLLLTFERAIAVHEDPACALHRRQGDARLRRLRGQRSEQWS